MLHITVRSFWKSHSTILNKKQGMLSYGILLLQNNAQLQVAVQTKEHMLGTTGPLLPTVQTQCLVTLTSSSQLKYDITIIVQHCLSSLAALTYKEGVQKLISIYDTCLKFMKTMSESSLSYDLPYKNKTVQIKLTTWSWSGDTERLPVFSLQY